MALRTTLAPQLRTTAQTMLVTNLLRLSGPQLEEAVTRELADNPALESAGANRSDGSALHPGSADPGRFRTSEWREFGDADPGDSDLAERIASHESLLDQIVNQVRLIAPADELEIIVYLIDCLDEHGFLKVPEEQLAQEMGVSPERVRRAITCLQQLDPPGIGARDVRECFALQCDDLETRGVDCSMVRCILEKAWDDFLHQRWNSAARRTGLSVDQIQVALRLMRGHFHPFPLLLLPNTTSDEIRLGAPDLVVRRGIHPDEAKWIVEVPTAYQAELRISPIFQRAAHASTSRELGVQPTQRQWVQQAVERARVFISALEQRQSMLQRIGEFLVEYQSDFFESGFRYLRPLTRAQVARALGVHESTISRAVSDKILQLPSGRLIELGDLFDGSLAAKEAIRELVASSNESLSDREIAERLRSHSFELSRRTVAKYREQLGIPTVGLRKRAKETATPRG